MEEGDHSPPSNGVFPAILFRLAPNLRDVHPGWVGPGVSVDLRDCRVRQRVTGRLAVPNPSRSMPRLSGGRARRERKFRPGINSVDPAKVVPEPHAQAFVIQAGRPPSPFPRTPGTTRTMPERGREGGVRKPSSLFLWKSYHILIRSTVGHYLTSVRGSTRYELYPQVRPRGNYGRTHQSAHLPYLITLQCVSAKIGFDIKACPQSCIAGHRTGPPPPAILYCTRRTTTSNGLSHPDRRFAVFDYKNTWGVGL